MSRIRWLPYLSQFKMMLEKIFHCRRKRLTCIVSNRSVSVEWKNRFCCFTAWIPTYVVASTYNLLEGRCATCQDQMCRISIELIARAVLLRRHVVFVKTYALLQQWLSTCATRAASTKTFSVKGSAFFCSSLSHSWTGFQQSSPLFL